MQDVLTDALARFGCTAQTPPTLIGAGTLNHNYFVRTERGVFVLRRIRDDQPDANVANEHETIGWVASRGIPAPTPVMPNDADARSPGGELPPTCIRIESVGSSGATEPSRWALFPFVDGRRIARGELHANEAAVLGDTHGRLHALLQEHPRSRDAPFTMQWSAEQSAAALERIEAIVRSSNASAEALDGLLLQRRLLDAYDIRPPSAFADLPCQWLHGDFHVEQILLRGDSTVAAILDWELCQASARVWEFVRSLSFSGLLNGHPNAITYLDSYRRHVAIERDELERGLELWWQSRVVGVWVWWAAFVTRNSRVHQFLPDTVATLRRISERGWCEQVTRQLLDAAR